jgi:hypothetical protein
VLEALTDRVVLTRQVGRVCVTVNLFGCHFVTCKDALVRKLQMVFSASKVRKSSAILTYYTIRNARQSHHL